MFFGLSNDIFNKLIKENFDTNIIINIYIYTFKIEKKFFLKIHENYFILLYLFLIL